MASWGPPVFAANSLTVAVHRASFLGNGKECLGLETTWRVAGKELLESPRTSPEVPRTSLEVPQRLPRSSLTVELNSDFQGFPRSFPDFPQSSLDFPASLTDLPGGQPLLTHKNLSLSLRHTANKNKLRSKPIHTNPVRNFPMLTQGIWT